MTPYLGLLGPGLSLRISVKYLEIDSVTSFCPAVRKARETKSVDSHLAVHRLARTRDGCLTAGCCTYKDLQPGNGDGNLSKDAADDELYTWIVLGSMLQSLKQQCLLTVKSVNEWNPDDLIEETWRELKGVVPRSQICEVVTGLADRYKDARVKAYIPILIRRQAIELLNGKHIAISDVLKEHKNSMPDIS